jgi:hypothetical protein
VYIKQRQTRRIAKLSTGAIAEFPTGHGKCGVAIFMDDAISDLQAIIACGFEDQGRFRSHDMFGSKSDFAFWRFQDEAWNGPEGTRYPRIGV